MTNYENMELIRAALERLRAKRQGSFFCHNTSHGLCAVQLGCDAADSPCRDCPFPTKKK